MYSRKVSLGFSNSDGDSKTRVMMSDWVLGGSLSIEDSTILSRSSRGIDSNRLSITRTRSEAELYRYASTLSNPSSRKRFSTPIYGVGLRRLVVNCGSLDCFRIRNNSESNRVPEKCFPAFELNVVTSSCRSLGDCPNRSAGTRRSR
ncbi:MAG: hypothetical protein RLZZ396_1146 [Planctomycetota bacterium]